MEQWEGITNVMLNLIVLDNLHKLNKLNKVKKPDQKNLMNLSKLILLVELEIDIEVEIEVLKNLIRSHQNQLDKDLEKEVILKHQDKNEKTKGEWARDI